ncbi:hypothetical protein A2872_02185 [Candidatus Gottesmanbacteria bacterium RIFCSPHIGHO2_01_FULL_42_12]|uniref:Uncharacterized protein n=1 Tax=Candidatus Gottesmanbacteria bacterium RIFCSPHIGHO2_01_FULL_42_12 TaxID=1798377 RepID=A0A1F5Z5N9_9BACT|nr:MAG: hypothetical protein A2872_02185 [Candidatus Gottesmanbacteria bacterium RIFCSPHIGHO2_01_FULL_42_12]
MTTRRLGGVEVRDAYVEVGDLKIPVLDSLAEVIFSGGMEDLNKVLSSFSYMCRDCLVVIAGKDLGPDARIVYRELKGAGGNERQGIFNGRVSLYASATGEIPRHVDLSIEGGNLALACKVSKIEGTGRSSVGTTRVRLIKFPA